MPPRKAVKREALPAPAEGASQLTEYELQRLQHIRRNQEYMALLGVKAAASALAPPTAAPSKPRVKRERPVTDPADQRRSGRLAGAPAEHDGAVLDEASEGEEDAAPRRKRNAAERDAEARALLADSQRWLAESRAALRRLGGDGVAPSSDCGWRAEAVRRWGDGVVPSLPPGGSWEAFVASRLTTPPPPSDLDLLQEYYSHDTWQLLVACVLMARVSSHAVKTNTIGGFFQRHPTPTAFLAAEPAAVQTLLHPLGLFPGRMASLVAISRRYLEAPVFDVGLTPESKVYGVGAFGVASYRIFVRGDLTCDPEDATLRQFVAWQKRRAAKG